MSRTRRQRTDTEPALNPAFMAIGAVTVLLAVVVLLISMRAQDGIPGRSYYDLTVQFAGDGGAPVLPPPGSDVRIAGRRIGQTRESRLERGVATLDLQLDSDVGELPADTTAAVRAQGLLGAKYVDVVPGTSPRRLPSGSFIAPRRTSIATTLSDVVQALDGPRRGSLGMMLRGLGGGLAGRGGQLNDGLRDLATGLRSARLTIGALARDHRLPELVRQAEAAVAALDPVGDELAATFAPAEKALRPFAQERSRVAQLLSVAPGALEGTRRSLAESDPLLSRAERFAAAATEFTAAAPRALDSVTGVLRDGRRPLRHARRVLLTARAAVPPTLKLTTALNPVLPRLGDVLDLARDPSRTLGAYGCDIDRWGVTWRSFLGYAPRGQSGPLGPLTILRTTLVGGGGVPGIPNPTPGAAVDGNITPCEPDRGQR
jgi:phospholipid/cholesterol/gamma-HCH transport system substrate-binding protein